MSSPFRLNPIPLWMLFIWCISKMFQYFFNQKHTIWEFTWQKCLKLVDENEYDLYVYATSTVMTVITLSLIALFCSFDYFEKPNFIRKYKVQPNTNTPLDMKKFKRTVIYVSINSLGFVVPTLILQFYLHKWNGIPDIHKLPNILTIVLQVYLSNYIYDVFFYIFHRILHHRLLYKHIHKIHHEWTSSIALANIHAHPIEHIFINVIPIIIPSLVLKSHIGTIWLWLIHFSISSTTDHSGYHLPFLHSNEFHDFHHLKSNTNYSGLGLMDWIFNTDKLFRGTIYEKRDRVLWTFESARELYPDEKTKKESLDVPVN